MDRHTESKRWGIPPTKRWGCEPGGIQAKIVLDDLVEKLPEHMDLEEIRGRVDDFTPYVMVALQVGQTTRSRTMLISCLCPALILHMSCQGPADALLISC